MDGVSDSDEAPVREYRGVVSRLDPGGRFGYVQCVAGSFIFVVGQALTHRLAARLSVGGAVVVLLDDDDRVAELRLA